MQIIPYDENTKSGWKSYPIRVQGQIKSPCCAFPTLLVESMPGGFVTQNCSKCGEYMTPSEEEFENLDLWVSCPRCRRRMSSQMVAKNYGFVCKQCAVAILLASILPRWRELV